MLYAISSNGSMVDSHFGRCEEYLLVSIDDSTKKLVSKEIIKNPGHEPGLIPKFLHEKGVNCIVTGGMGQRAIAFFDEFKIAVVLGVTGSLKDVVDKLLAGTLENASSLCDHSGCGEHEHGHEHDHGQAEHGGGGAHRRGCEK
jgi:predicted Fe-Mo cluster-binding NifX family protein